MNMIVRILKRIGHKPAVVAHADVDCGSFLSGIDYRGAETAMPLWTNDLYGFRIFFQIACYLFPGHIPNKIRFITRRRPAAGYLTDIPHNRIHIFARRCADTMNMVTAYEKTD